MNKENPLISILFNLVIPVIFLSKFSSEQSLGPLYAMLFSLSFPLGYGIYRFVVTRNFDFISIVSFVSILLTGTMGLFKLDGIWFAFKEALIPLVIAVSFVFAFFYNKNKIYDFILNKNIFNTEIIYKKVYELKCKEKLYLILNSSIYYLIASFFISAILNFILAILIIKSPAGTEMFNKELAKMIALSMPVITVPAAAVFGFAVWNLLKGLKDITGLNIDKLIKK